MNHIKQTDYLFENGANLATVAELVQHGEFGSAVSAVEDGNVQEVMQMLRAQRADDFNAAEHFEAPEEKKTGRAKKVALIGLATMVAGCTGAGAVKDKAPEAPQAASQFDATQFDNDTIKILLGENPEQTITQYITDSKIKEAYTGLSVLYQAQNRNEQLEKKIETQLDQRLLEDIGLTYETKTITKKVVKEDGTEVEEKVPAISKKVAEKTEAEVIQTIIQYLCDSPSRVYLTAEHITEIKAAKNQAAAMELAAKYIQQDTSRISALVQSDGEKTIVYVDLMGTDEKTGYAIIKIEKGKVVDITTDKDENISQDQLESLVPKLVDQNRPLGQSVAAYTTSGERITGFGGRAYTSQDAEFAALAEIVKGLGINVNSNDSIALAEGKDSTGKKMNYVQVGFAIEPVGDRDLLKETAYNQAIKTVRESRGQSVVEAWKVLNEFYTNEKTGHGDRENIESLVRAYVLENPDQEVAFFDWHEGKGSDGQPVIKHRTTPETAKLGDLYALLGNTQATSVILSYLTQDVQNYSFEQIEGIITRAKDVEELRQKGIRGTPLDEAQESAVNKQYKMSLDTEKSETEIVRIK